MVKKKQAHAIDRAVEAPIDETAVLRRMLNTPPPPKKEKEAKKKKPA